VVPRTLRSCSANASQGEDANAKSQFKRIDNGLGPRAAAAALEYDYNYLFIACTTDSRNGQPLKDAAKSIVKHLSDLPMQLSAENIEDMLTRISKKQVKTKPYTSREAFVQGGQDETRPFMLQDTTGIFLSRWMIDKIINSNGADPIVEVITSTAHDRTDPRLIVMGRTRRGKGEFLPQIFNTLELKPNPRRKCIMETYSNLNLYEADDISKLAPTRIHLDTDTCPEDYFFKKYMTDSVGSEDFTYAPSVMARCPEQFVKDGLAKSFGVYPDTMLEMIKQSNRTDVVIAQSMIERKRKAKAEEEEELARHVQEEKRRQQEEDEAELAWFEEQEAKRAKII
jgi:hypothetical protein